MQVLILFNDTIDGYEKNRFYNVCCVSLLLKLIIWGKQKGQIQ